MEKVTENSEKIWPDDLFEINDIVALGERHGKDDETILSLLEQFSSKITAVFCEEPVSLQPSIDLYLKTGEISQELESLFNGAEKEGKNIRIGMLKILDRLKQYNIKIICVDSSKNKTDEYKNKSLQGHYYLKRESRDEDMFNNIMNYYRANSGKYVVICGASHLAEGEHLHGGNETLGTRLKKTMPDKIESIILS